MKGPVKQWVDQSAYDLGTARAMYKMGRYLYVAFMCQQAIEKHLKAIICNETDKMPPYIHNLTVLSEHIHLDLTDDQLDFLDILSKYYLNARYPVIKQNMAALLDKRECFDLLKKTEEFGKWLKRGYGI